ncbi:hypothetical protein H0H92_010303 [Tricholoma furcatifolium]|nr:hypothetical protein H0H92_010303 [Tricholoma furcatifolium]
MKTVARLVVPALFGIGDGSKRETRDRVEDLIDWNTFYYKDGENCTGFLLHPIFQEILNKTWFKSKTDEGPTHVEFLAGGIPLITIALIATIVECCLDEWVSGERADVPFTAAQYKTKFEAHFKIIVTFEAKTRKANIIPRLRQHMLKKARKHARVEVPGVTKRVLKLEDTNVEAAKKEWENMDFSETESEDE